MTTMTFDQIHAAQAKIASRHGQAACRIQALESGLTKKLIDYAMGIIAVNELNADAAELVLCREIAAENTTEALEHFRKLAEQIAARIKTEQSRGEVIDQRRTFAAGWNAIVSRTSGFSLDEVAALEGIRTSDITGPEWHRFQTLRASFGSQLESTQTFAEYANLPFIDQTTIV